MELKLEIQKNLINAAVSFYPYLVELKLSNSGTTFVSSSSFYPYLVELKHSALPG